MPALGRDTCDTEQVFQQANYMALICLPETVQSATDIDAKPFDCIALSAEEKVKSVLSVCICKQCFDISKYTGLGGTPVYVGADRYYKGVFSVFHAARSSNETFSKSCTGKSVCATGLGLAGRVGKIEGSSMWLASPTVGHTLVIG